MSFHGVSNWPPVWTQVRERAKIVRDEVGILRYTHSYEASSNKCFLVIEYEGEHYVGTLLFDDVTFARQITVLLRQYIGRSIEEIGDLDLSFTLWANLVKLNNARFTVFGLDCVNGFIAPSSCVKFGQSSQTVLLTWSCFPPAGVAASHFDRSFC
jgi:hypothetical protein